MIVQDTGTWALQRKFCINNSAQLAELETIEEMELLEKYITMKGGTFRMMNNKKQEIFDFKSI